MPFLQKYGVARHIYIAIPKASTGQHAVGADWTPAAGDVKVSKDGGAAANVTNLPTAIAMGNSALWDFHLTATELEAAQVVITVADSATKAVEDTGFVIETYGHASAQHAFDLDATLTAEAVFQRAFSSDYGDFTFDELMKIIVAALAGKASGLPTAPKFRDLADQADVISATTDEHGNRSAVTLTP